MFYIMLDEKDNILLVCGAELSYNMGMSESELLQKGFFIESLPLEEYREDMSSILKCRNRDTKELYYEYNPIPKTIEDTVKSLGEQLAQEKLKNMQKDMTISQLGQELASIKLDVISIKGGM